MPFMKGQSGNPEGRRVEPRPWQEALRLAVSDMTPDGRQRLRAIAEKVVEQALAGDMEAIREIGNRLDGRPRQEVALDASVDVSGEDPASILASRRERREGSSTVSAPSTRAPGLGG